MTFSKLIAVILATVTCTLFMSSTLNAQSGNSMWQRRQTNITNPYSDVKAMRPGDLVVVLINEKSGVQNRDQRSLDKQGTSDLSATGNVGVSGFVGTASGGGTLDEQTNSSRTFAGNTQYRSEREFTDRFAMTVIDVLPNGNLLVGGKRQVEIEGDQKTLLVSGIVRKYDVSAQNTVTSQDVANLSIRYLSNGKNGSERRFINQGWLGRQANRWWGRK